MSKPFLYTVLIVQSLFIMAIAYIELPYAYSGENMRSAYYYGCVFANRKPEIDCGAQSQLFYETLEDLYRQIWEK